MYYNSYYQYQKFTYIVFFFYIGKINTDFEYFHLFWADKIKNVLELNLNGVKKYENILRTSEAENCYFFKNAQPGLEKCGSYKKKSVI